MKLHAKASIPFVGEPFLALVEEPSGPWRAPVRNRSVIAAERTSSDDIPCVFAPPGSAAGDGAIPLPEELSYLKPGDIVRVNPEGGELRVVYRKNSRHNSMLLTERCNSRCVMCSQPPRDVADGFLAEEVLEAIPLMSPKTEELGLSGGEPTLLGGRLVDIVEAAKRHLPTTALHVLSNGRTFRFLRYAQRIADVRHADLMIGVPLYSDIASLHDYVVQARGAFSETILGLMNLGRVGVRIEIRVVIHRDTYARLPQLARFIARNLPFVDQVVLMGLELMGFAKTNLEALWIDPVDYHRELDTAVATLDSAGLRVRIYNHPLCLLPRSLWSFAARSISDWKNTYLPQCSDCSVGDECSGFFASSALRTSPHVAAITPGPARFDS